MWFQDLGRAYIYIYIYLYMYVYIYIYYICLCVYIFIYIHILYIYMYVCMYVESLNTPRLTKKIADLFLFSPSLFQYPRLRLGSCPGKARSTSFPVVGKLPFSCEHHVPSMYVCIYIYICMCLYIYIYMYTYICICIFF